MPLTSETEFIAQHSNIRTEPTTDPEKFLIYAWEGRSQKAGGNWKITVPLTVISKIPLQLPSELITSRKSKKLPPRITLGKPVPPEPPVVMGGGVPVLGLTASSKVDPKTRKRSDEYKLLRSQPLPAQERHEYKTYPEDIRPGQNIRRKRQAVDTETENETIYHSYLALAWQYLGLQDRVLDCLNNMEPACIAHYLPPEILEQSFYSVTQNPQKKRQTMRFSSALRHRMEIFVSQGSVALLLGNLRAVAMQIEITMNRTLSENEIHELENFQAFEELAALDRGLSVLYLYPFHNIYEMERVEEKRAGNSSKYKHNVHAKELSYSQPLREQRCLLQPGPLQKQLQKYAHPALSLA